MADKPSLRFADGGSLITRWARSVTRPDATAGRLRQADEPTPTPAGIRFQDGGVVPGKGKGDKIPAKYEPGEFVVSNDMIEDNPGLREGLSSLRAETLARRGKTVAEADAGIVTPKGLRAMDGVDVLERPMTPDDRRAFVRDPGPGNPRVAGGPSNEARAWQQGRAAPAAAPTVPAPAAAPSPAKPAGRFSALRNAGAAVFNNPVTRTLLSAPAGVAMAGLTPTTLADGTLPQSVLDAMKKPYDPNMPPGDYSDPVPAPPAATPTTATPPAATPTTAADAPGIRRVGSGSSPLFTNMPDDGLLGNNNLMKRGQVSAQNMAAADALAARGQALRAGAPANQQVGGGNITPVISGSGFGLLDADARRERSLRMDAEQFKPGARTALRQFYDRQAQGDELASAERVAGMRDATDRRGQDMSLEGTRMEVQGRAGAEQSKALRDEQMRQVAGAIYEQAGNVEQAKALALRMGLPDLAKSFDGMATAEQTRSFNASNNAREDFQMFNPDGTLNKADSDAAYQAVTKILPGYDQMSESARKNVKPDAQALAGIYRKLRNNPEMGWDKVNPFNTKGAARDSMPNFKGGKLVQNGVAGIFTPGSGLGEWYIEKDGKRLPLGNLSEREIEILEHQTKTGEWLNAPKKTQKGG